MKEKIKVTVQVNLQNSSRAYLMGGTFALLGVDARIILNWVFKEKKGARIAQSV
jgi:hypothetical protein